MDSRDIKRLENRIGKIVKLYSGAKVKITALRTDEYEMEEFDYCGMDEEGDRCFIKESAIYNYSDNMIREDSV